MEEIAIIDEHLKRQPRPKPSKSRGKIKKERLEYETIDYDKDTHDQVTDNTNSGKERKHKKHYVNEGFIEDAEMDFDKRQKVKKKRERALSRQADLEAEINHNDHQDIDMDNTNRERKSKKKSKKLKPPSSERNDTNQDDPHDDLTEIERQLELLGTTQVYGEHIEENEEEIKPKKKKKRKPRTTKEDTVESLMHEYDENLNSYDQPNDTGYESFNNKKEKLHKKKKKLNGLSQVNDEDEVQPIVVHYTSDQGESPKIIRKKKRHKNRRNDDRDDDIVKSGECSPVLHSRVIKVHEKKHQRTNSGDEELYMEGEMEEIKKTSKLKKKKRQKDIEKSVDNFYEESEDTIDGYGAYDLVDKLEEITLPSEKMHHRKEASGTEMQDEAEEELYRQKKSKKKSARSKHKKEDNAYIKTEVVPFTLDSGSDSEVAEKECIKTNVGYKKTQSFDKRAIVSESLDASAQMKKSNVEESLQNVSKPTKRFAFDEETDTEESENSAHEESEDEVEAPLKHQIIGKGKGSPKKSKKEEAKNHPKSLIAQSSKFEKDSEDVPEQAGKPPKSTRKSQCGLSHGSSHSSLSSPLKGIFGIDGNSYDVFEKEDCITWSCVSGASKVPKSRKKSFVRSMSATGGSFRGSVASLGTAEVDELNTIFYQDILGVSIKKERRSTKKLADSVCIGMIIYTFDKKEYNRLKDRPILFQHPSEMECTMWLEMIKEKLKEFNRPRSVKIFIQPWAGISRTSMLTYNTKVRQIFECAEMEEDATVVNHNEHIKQEVTHMDLNTVDCVVAIGGDGTASRVISAVLNKSQEMQGVEKRQHFTPVKPPVTFGIIPTGMTNQLAHSVMGLEDPVTAAIHIVLGTTRPVDVCSVFRDDQFANWSFNGHYGYFGNVLSFLHRYALFGEKKVDAAFMKALTKSKFRSYECDVQYIKASSSDRNSVTDGKVCTSECRRCNFDPDCSFGSAYSDEVHELDQLQDSQDSQGIVELKDKSRWTTVKGNYINVSVFSTAGRSNLSPLGMSKFTHLADGCIDLALVHSVDRKQFLRFLRRHGKKKNQFDFPFVETHRCREVRVQLRLKETWKHKDYDYDDIEYEVKKSEEQELKRTESVEVIDELESDDSDDISMDNLDVEDSEDEEEEIIEEKSSKKKGKEEKQKDKKKNKDKDENKSNKSGEKKRRFSFFGKKKKDEKPKGSDEEAENENNEVIDLGQSDLDSDTEVKSVKRTGEFVHVLELESSDEEIEEVETSTKKKKDKQKQSTTTKKKQKESLFHITPALPENERKPYQPPDYLEMDREYRKKKNRKKDEKKKSKAERKMRAYWNLDNELQPEGCYHFRVHQGLVRIHGAGVAVETETDEVTMKCLGMF